MTGMAGWSSPEYAVKQVLFASSQITTWIYGHSNYTTDLMIGNTYLVSNPVRYVFFNENTHLNDSAMKEV